MENKYTLLFQKSVPWELEERKEAFIIYGMYGGLKYQIAIVPILVVDEPDYREVFKKESRARAERILKAVNHHEEMVSSLKRVMTYFERYACGGYTKCHDGTVSIDPGSTYEQLSTLLSKIEAK